MRIRTKLGALACAAGLATIAVYEEDDLIEKARRMGTVMRGLMEDLEKRHPSVGATRNIGLFGIFELIRRIPKEVPRWGASTKW